MADKDLKLETKCYDANEYGYLYGLNKRIPDEDFEKIKPYMRNFRRKDFVDGIIKVTGRPEGYRCREKDVAKVEEILGIEKIICKEKPYLFIIAVAVSAASNFYFFYMII